MVIDNTYFRGEIYISHAKPSVSDEVLEVEGDIKSFIDEYSRECLIQCLGPKLFNEFAEELNPAQPNGIDLASHDKWDHLLNGLTYVDSKGDTVVWRGLRYKDAPTGDYKSPIANYVYFYYEKHDHITRSDIGHVQENGKNSWNVAPTEKVVRAWNKFVDQIQGRELAPTVINKYGMIGVDYMFQEDHWHVSLYKFLEDSNKLVPNTYEGFVPKHWRRINIYGL